MAEGSDFLSKFPTAATAEALAAVARTGRKHLSAAVHVAGPAAVVAAPDREAFGIGALRGKKRVTLDHKPDPVERHAHEGLRYYADLSLSRGAPPTHARPIGLDSSAVAVHLREQFGDARPSTASVESAPRQLFAAAPSAADIPGVRSSMDGGVGGVRRARPSTARPVLHTADDARHPIALPSGGLMLPHPSPTKGKAHFGGRIAEQSAGGDGPVPLLVGPGSRGRKHLGTTDAHATDHLKVGPLGLTGDEGRPATAPLSGHSRGGVGGLAARTHRAGAGVASSLVSLDSVQLAASAQASGGSSPGTSRRRELWSSHLSGQGVGSLLALPAGTSTAEPAPSGGSRLVTSYAATFTGAAEGGPASHPRPQRGLAPAPPTVRGGPADPYRPTRIY